MGSEEIAVKEVKLDASHAVRGFIDVRPHLAKDSLILWVDSKSELLFKGDPFGREVSVTSIRYNHDSTRYRVEGHSEGKYYFGDYEVGQLYLFEVIKKPDSSS